METSEAQGRRGGTSRGWARGIALLAGVTLVVRLWAVIPVFSPTTDEPADIGGAVAMVEAGKSIATVSHAPLPRWVMAVPLWHDGARLPMCRGKTVVGPEDLGYALGTRVLYGEKLPFRDLLTHVRRAMLIFPVLALFYLYRLGQLLADERVACFAVVLFSLDPTLLGHGWLATSDVPGCAGVLAALYYGYRWIVRPTTPRAAVAGAVVGLAVATKFSCLFVIPAIALVAWRLRQRFSISPRVLLWQAPLASFAGFVALWATYQFDIGPLGDAASFSSRLTRTPIPMPSFFLGVGNLWMHNRVGMLAYLNGYVSRQGWWYYFPEVLLLKSALSSLLATALAVVLRAVSKKPSHSWTGLAIASPLVVFGYFLLSSKYDMGIRYVLPVIALLQLFTAWQLGRGRWSIVLTCFIAGAAVEVGLAHPDYLSFFNVVAGGAAGGSRYALDSNLDWNQDLFRLADYIHSRPQLRPYSLRLTGFRNGPLLSNLAIDSAALDRPVHGTYLFISKDKRLLHRVLPWLAGREPVATVGTSIDVYDLRDAGSPYEPEDVPGPDDPSAYFGDQLP